MDYSFLVGVGVMGSNFVVGVTNIIVVGDND